MFAARAIVGVSGGVERMITNIMNELVERGHQISLITWDIDPEGLPFYHLHKRIVWRKLQIGDPATKASKSILIQRMRAVRSIVRDLAPDVIVGFQDGPSMSMLAFTLGMGIPVVAAERNAPSRFQHTESGNRRFVTFAAFAFCSNVIVQLESYREGYPAFLHRKMKAIANPVLQQKAFAAPAVPAEDGKFTLLSVGRLSYQKNYPVLVEAFAMLAKQHPNWRLRIVGEGEDRAKLETLAVKLGLGAEQFEMPGSDNGIYAQYRSANLFCLPSLWEGFPNALAEAFACGLPAVGFGECAGVNELIKSGKNGFLVKDGWSAEALSKSLSKLMLQHELRAEMGRRAVESVSLYEPREIYSQWEQVLMQANRR